MLSLPFYRTPQTMEIVRTATKTPTNSITKMIPVNEITTRDKNDTRSSHKSETLRSRSNTGTMGTLTWAQERYTPVLHDAWAKAQPQSQHQSVVKLGGANGCWLRPLFFMWF